MSRWSALKVWLHLTPQYFQAPWATRRFWVPVFRWLGLLDPSISRGRLLLRVAFGIVPVAILLGWLFALLDLLTLPWQRRYARRCRVLRQRARRVTRALRPREPKPLFYADKCGFQRYLAADARAARKAFKKLYEKDV